MGVLEYEYLSVNVCGSLNAQGSAAHLTHQDMPKEGRRRDDGILVVEHRNEQAMRSEEFLELEQRMAKTDADTRSAFNDFRQYSEFLTEQLEERLTKRMDAKFAVVDQRFAQIDRRFEEIMLIMERRFTYIERRFDRLEERLFLEGRTRKDN